MGSKGLRFLAEPSLTAARMVLAFTGWMDGGDVSTGTVRCLIEKLGAEAFAEIDPEEFYIYNFPGPMELSSLLRPRAVIEGGVIRAFDPPANTFYGSERGNLILFEGKEPNVRWARFADCIFEVAARFGVTDVYFIGSFAGLVPHTRAPRIYSTVSDESVKETMAGFGLRFSNYEGPGGIATYLTVQAAARGLKMASLVAEIPAYVQGRNPKCIEAMVRQAAAVLGLTIDLDDLRRVSDALEERLNLAVETRAELAKQVRKLEEDYDHEIFDTQLGDLKDWLEQQGVRLD